ncbi:peptidoglycan recognition family protein [Streptomyces sp. B8F3]|uniref:peptidoglycan recognition protein family protein n=1 Tax=Streptomyces sp. B8F3 TaxID=3153573 RepID=UPI00325DCB1A
MASPLSADALVRALKREGVHVVEHRSWRTHNRNHQGPFGPVNGVVIHHTASTGTDASVRLCYDGRPDLPGPLCHGVIAKDGTVHLVGHGRANHAGLGDDDVLRRVIAEDYGTTPPTPNENNTDGNTRFYGFEAINRGDGYDPWPHAQLEAIERASAAICRAHDWGAKSVIGHKEWTNQKIDPHGFGMPGMRERVAERLRHPAGWDPDQEDEVTKDDIERIAAAVCDRLANQDGVYPAPDDSESYATNKFWKFKSHVETQTRAARSARRAAESADSKLDQVLALLRGK